MKIEPPRKITRKFVHLQIPKTVQIELTHRCNLNCVHCLRDDRSTPELSTAKWKTVLAELSAMKCLGITFTGGEPSVRADLPEIIREASRLGMGVSLLTNGQNLDAAFFTSVEGAKLAFLRVSLYGFSARTHDRYTRVPGSFERTLRTLKLSRERGIDTRIAYFFFRNNQDEIGAARNFAKEHGLTIATDFVLARSDTGRLPAGRLSLSAEGIQAVERMNPVFSSPELQNTGSAAAPCGMGRSLAGIGPDGTVFPCTTLRFPVGNLATDSFESIWRRSPKLLLFRSASTEGYRYCNTCPLIEKCHLCPGDNLTETGSLFKPARRHCALTHLLFGGGQKEDLPPLLKADRVALNHVGGARDEEGLHTA